MRVVSVNVGRPREVVHDGELLRTSIWKQAVAGPVHVGTLNLAGDRQSDLSVHGGPDKAVYAYSADHYDYWRAELPGVALPWGAFGENLTLSGLDERHLGIGDQLRIGSAELMVTQPRLPCFKLGLRLGRDDIIKRFQASGRSGCYLRVLVEGTVTAGDPVTRIAVGGFGITIAELFGLATAGAADSELLRRASLLPTIPASWREHYAHRLARQTAGSRKAARHSAAPEDP
jgi:MOSC domain-containing protein YiiM